MLDRIIKFSISHKLIILLFTVFIIGFGLYSLSQIPVGAVPVFALLALADDEVDVLWKVGRIAPPQTPMVEIVTFLSEELIELTCVVNSSGVRHWR